MGRNFTECITSCATTAGCVDISYSSGGPCFFKKSVGETTPEAGTCDALLISSSECSSSSTSTSSSAASMSSIAASTTSAPPSCPTPTCSPPSGPISSGTIMNPGFETPGTTPDWAYIAGQFPGNTFYFPYKNDDQWPAHSGTHYGYQLFRVHTDYGEFGTTILDLTPCVRYTVTFWLLKNTNAQAVLSVEGCSLLTAPTGADEDYVQSSFTFTAVDTIANFAIKGNCPSFDGLCGLLFDDFEIAPAQVQ